MSTNQRILRIALALIPGILAMLGRLVLTLNETRWNFYWIAGIPALLAAVIVIAIFLRVEGGFSVWSLPALTTGFLELMQILDQMLWAAFGPIYYPPPQLYEIGKAALNIIGILLLIAWLGGTIKLAQRLGAAAALGLTTLIGLFILDLFSPTYGVLIHHPDLITPVALLDALVIFPYTIILPVWVLASERERAQRTALLIVPGAAYLFSLLIWLLFAIPLNEGISGAPTVAEMTTRALLTSPLFMGIPWVIQAVIVMLCRQLNRPAPPAINRTPEPSMS